MRRRGLILFIAVAVAFLAIRGFVAWSDWSDKASTPAAPSSGLPTRSVDAGAVQVKIEPRQIDSGGARFKVSFDTHSVDLSTDLPREATLQVDASDWTAIAWSGDGPGGHHREGELRFAASGPAQGTARLVISGLPGPVDVTWELGS